MTEATAPDVKLYISVISSRQWPARFGESLANLMFHIGQLHLGGRLTGLRLKISRQAHPSVTRNADLVEAIAHDFTHFLSLDDDQTFPGDVVERMLLAQKPVVTANYRKKIMQVQYVCSGLDGLELNSTDRTGLERIKSMGMGMALIELAAIKQIGAPYCAAPWNIDTGQHVIEDEYFCRRLWDHNVELWCDHDLSRLIGHVGEHEYRLPELSTALSLVEQAA